MNTRLMLIHALSPVHAGTGQSLGAIDLAIARDRATGMPYIPGSSIKGTLRALSVDKHRKDTFKVFGPETDGASDHAGSVSIGDANLLLMPARSVAGTFAWVTSPFLLARFARDAQEAGITPPGISDLGTVQECRVCSNDSLLRVKGDKGQQEVVFEDLDLTVTSTDAAPWATFIGKLLFPKDDFWQDGLKKRLCIVHDDVMAFLSSHAIDVSARIRMDQDTGTVERLPPNFSKWCRMWRRSTCSRGMSS